MRIRDLLTVPNLEFGMLSLKVVTFISEYLAVILSC